MERKRDVAVVIQSVVQFYNIKNGIDALISDGINCDIYVPTYFDNEGFKDIYDETYKKLTALKYNVKRKPNKNKYKVLLEAYPIDHIININHEYRLNYLYSSSVGAKPDIVLRPEFYVYYDGVLLYNYEENEYLSAYCKTFLIGNLKFKNFKKIKNNSKKKTILYLPTYGNSSDIEDTIKIIGELRKEYNVYIKSHHGTDFLKSEKSKIDLLRKSCDKYYDSSENIIDLLKEADLVLSDNSGAIFDAIYSETPVVIFSKDTNRNKINDNFNTKQYDLITSGIIPFTDDVNSINKIVRQGLSKEIAEKQIALKKTDFYCPKNLTTDFVNVVKKFLKNDINIKYKTLHDRLKTWNDELKSENLKIINNYNVLDLAYKELMKKSDELYKDKVRLEEENLILKESIKLYNNKVNRIYMKIRSKLGGKNGKN